MQDYRLSCYSKLNLRPEELAFLAVLVRRADDDTAAVDLIAEAVEFVQLAIDGVVERLRGVDITINNCIR